MVTEKNIITLVLEVRKLPQGKRIICAGLRFVDLYKNTEGKKRAQLLQFAQEVAAGMLKIEEVEKGLEYFESKKSRGKKRLNFLRLKKTRAKKGLHILKPQKRQGQKKGRYFEKQF